MAKRTSTVHINDAFIPFLKDTHRYDILWGGAGCFDGETLVNTTTGYRKISEIKLGEMVLSFNQNTLQPEYKQVVNKFCYMVRNIRQKMITFVLDNQLIKCTHGHKFYLQGTWIEAAELAIRTMETCEQREWDLLHQQFRAAFDNKSLQLWEDSDNETCFRWVRVLPDNDCKKRGHIGEKSHDKNTQTCCKGICTKPDEPTGSKPQRWEQEEQQLRKLGVGNSPSECSAFICEQITDEHWVEKSNKQINGTRHNGNKTSPTSIVNSENDRPVKEIRSSNRHYQGNSLQTGQLLDSCEIDISRIQSIEVSDTPQLVYDLQVRHNENYCITTDNIIVHNSGKSVSASQKVVIRCLSETGTPEEPFRHRIAVIRKYRTSLKNSVYEQVKSVCMAMGISDYVTFNDSYLQIKFYNGSEIFFMGLDDPEKIKSLVVTSTWCEEASELEEADFNQIDLRMRGTMPYYQQHIITFNPISEDHWLKKKFFDNPSDMVYTMHSTYKDNRFNGEDYANVLEERYKYDENMYRIYVLGEWGIMKTGSEYYFNFRIEKHVSPNVKYIPGLPLHISFDFNVNPYISATISQIYRRELADKRSFYFVNVIDEFALKNPMNNTERLCEAIIDKWGAEMARGIQIYGDASGRNKGTRSNVSDYDIIEYAFAKYMSNNSMNVPKANPMIKKRRNFVNKLLYGGFNIEFKVNPDCKKLINDFQVAIEEQDGSKKKQMGKDSLSHVVYEKNGHHADCNDYFLCAAFERYYDNM